MEEIPQNIRERVIKATENLLPVKSRQQYDREYGIFGIWKDKNTILQITENVLMAYFQELLFRAKPDLPRELNDFLNDVQRHKKDFAFIRNVARNQKKYEKSYEETHNLFAEDLDNQLTQSPYYNKRYNYLDSQNLPMKNNIYDRSDQSSKFVQENDYRSYYPKDRYSKFIHSPVRLRREQDANYLDTNVKLHPNSIYGEIHRPEPKFPGNRFINVENKYRTGHVIAIDEDDVNDYQDLMPSDKKKREVEISIKSDGKLVKRIEETESGPKSIILNIKANDANEKGQLLNNPASMSAESNNGDSNSVTMPVQQTQINKNLNNVPSNSKTIPSIENANQNGAQSKNIGVPISSIPASNSALSNNKNVPSPFNQKNDDPAIESKPKYVKESGNQNKFANLQTYNLPEVSNEANDVDIRQKIDSYNSKSLEGNNRQPEDFENLRWPADNNQMAKSIDIAQNNIDKFTNIKDNSVMEGDLEEPKKESEFEKVQGLVVDNVNDNTIKESKIKYPNKRQSIKKKRWDGIQNGVDSIHLDPHDFQSNDMDNGDFNYVQPLEQEALELSKAENCKNEGPQIYLNPNEKYEVIEQSTKHILILPILGSPSGTDIQGSNNEKSIEEVLGDAVEKEIIKEEGTDINNKEGEANEYVSTNLGHQEEIEKEAEKEAEIEAEKEIEHEKEMENKECTHEPNNNSNGKEIEIEIGHKDPGHGHHREHEPGHHETIEGHGNHHEHGPGHHEKIGGHDIHHEHEPGHHEKIEEHGHHHEHEPGHHEKIEEHGHHHEHKPDHHEKIETEAEKEAEEEAEKEAEKETEIETIRHEKEMEDKSCRHENPNGKEIEIEIGHQDSGHGHHLGHEHAHPHDHICHENKRQAVKKKKKTKYVIKQDNNVKKTKKPKRDEKEQSDEAFRKSKRRHPVSKYERKRFRQHPKNRVDRADEVPLVDYYDFNELYGPPDDTFDFIPSFYKRQLKSVNYEYDPNMILEVGDHDEQEIRKFEEAEAEKDKINKINAKDKDAGDKSSVKSQGHRKKFKSDGDYSDEEDTYKSIVKIPLKKTRNQFAPATHITKDNDDDYNYEDLSDMEDEEEDVAYEEEKADDFDVDDIGTNNSNPEENDRFNLNNFMTAHMAIPEIVLEPTTNQYAGKSVVTDDSPTYKKNDQELTNGKTENKYDVAPVKEILQSPIAHGHGAGKKNQKRKKQENKKKGKKPKRNDEDQELTNANAENANDVDVETDVDTDEELLSPFARKHGGRKKEHKKEKYKKKGKKPKRNDEDQELTNTAAENEDNVESDEDLLQSPFARKHGERKGEHKKKKNKKKGRKPKRNDEALLDDPMEEAEINDLTEDISRFHGRGNRGYNIVKHKKINPKRADIESVNQQNDDLSKGEIPGQFEDRPLTSQEKQDLFLRYNPDFQRWPRFVQSDNAYRQLMRRRSLENREKYFRAHNMNRVPISNDYSIHPERPDFVKREEPEAEASTDAAESTNSATESTSVAAESTSVAAESTTVASESTSVAAESTSAVAESTSVAAEASSETGEAASSTSAAPAEEASQTTATTESFAEQQEQATETLPNMDTESILASAQETVDGAMLPQAANNILQTANSAIFENTTVPSLDGAGNGNMSLLNAGGTIEGSQQTQFHFTTNADDLTENAECMTGHKEIKNPCPDENATHIPVTLTSVLPIVPESATLYKINMSKTEFLDLKDIVDGALPRLIASQSLSNARGTVRHGLNSARFNMNLNMLNYDSNVETKLILNEMTKLMLKLKYHTTCQEIPANLKTYIKLITRNEMEDPMAKLKEMNDIDFDEHQSSYVFHGGEGDSIQNKGQSLRELLKKYNALPDNCKERAEPVREYIESHLAMIDNMSGKGGLKSTPGATLTETVTTIHPKAKKEISLSDLNSEQEKNLDGPLMEEGLNNQIPDANEAIEDRDKKNKREAADSRIVSDFRKELSTSTSPQYGKLAEAVRKLRHRRESARRIGEIYGRAKRQPTDNDENEEQAIKDDKGFESPLVINF